MGEYGGPFWMLEVFVQTHAGGRLLRNKPASVALRTSIGFPRISVPPRKHIAIPAE